MRQYFWVACWTFFSGILLAAGAGREPNDPGNPRLVDYKTLAFQPEVWERNKFSTMLLAWPGTNIVFLATNGIYNAELVSNWVRRLDQGWALYENIMGTRPMLLKHIDGRATIAAVPGFQFTCGAGCGFLGATGIELAMFYEWNYPALLRNSNAIPHYVFYEMGRNFYTLGGRHSAFTTGFAVFMRYVCMDELGCLDEDPTTRRTIEGVEKLIRKSDLPFLKMFTNADGLSEKEPRVKDSEGGWVDPSDQPVTYASAMLRLYRDHGGTDWARRCFHALAECPPATDKTKEGALKQSWHWLVAASIAARKDLCPVFAGDWRLPLSLVTQRELAAMDWSKENLSAVSVLARIQPKWLAAD